jgi:ferritin-like metal-binding protein YciE
MAIANLEDLLVLKLKSLYDIESEVLKALPKVIKNVESQELRDAFQIHLDETKIQKERLEQIFGILNEKPRKTRVEAIRGLIEDVLWFMKQDMKGEARDGALSGAVRYIEHYEIAGYSTAMLWAHRLGYDDIADILEETLQEEDAADGLLMDFGEHVDIDGSPDEIDESAEE